MSSMRLAFSSDRLRPLSSLAVDERAVVADVHAHEAERAERLLALGVTSGAAVTMLQTLPGVVFLCDQTELAVERSVADAILVRREERQR
jgi:Fe2+ transport system protein FeoA